MFSALSPIEPFIEFEVFRQYNAIPKSKNNAYADFIIDLPEDHDIYNIDWLAVWSEKIRLNFGHVDLTKVSDRIPPYLPMEMKVRNLGHSCKVGRL